MLFRKYVFVLGLVINPSFNLFTGVNVAEYSRSCIHYLGLGTYIITKISAGRLKPNAHDDNSLRVWHFKFLFSQGAKFKCRSRFLQWETRQNCAICEIVLKTCVISNSSTVVCTFEHVQFWGDCNPGCSNIIFFSTYLSKLKLFDNLLIEICLN